MCELSRLVQYYLLNEAGNYRKKESPMLEAKVYIHPGKPSSLFTFATHFNTILDLQPLTVDAQIETPGICYRPPVEVAFGGTLNWTVKDLQVWICYRYSVIFERTLTPRATVLMEIKPIMHGWGSATRPAKQRE